MSTYSTVIDSPVGPLTLTGDGEALTGLRFGGVGAAGEDHPDVFADAGRQLAEYFAGERTHFDLNLKPAGTPFQLRVWQGLCDIAYGSTASYRELAAEIGQPSAVRAVGMANNRNPIAIIVPCHRVIGADGSLVGYAGGLRIKRQLLELEGLAFDPSGLLSAGAQPLF